MRLLSRFAIFLVIAGLLVGWLARSGSGRPPRPWPWLLVFLPAVLHALLIGWRALELGIGLDAVLGYVGGSLLTAVVAVVFVVRSWRRRSWWLPLAPLLQAIAHTVAASLLGEHMAAVAEAPPLVGPALVLGLAIFSASASLVLLLGPERPQASARLEG